LGDQVCELSLSNDTSLVVDHDEHDEHDDDHLHDEEGVHDEATHEAHAMHHDHMVDLHADMDPHDHDDDEHSEDDDEHSEDADELVPMKMWMLAGIFVMGVGGAAVPLAVRAVDSDRIARCVHIVHHASCRNLDPLPSLLPRLPHLSSFSAPPCL